MDSSLTTTTNFPAIDVLKLWQKEGILTDEDISRATAHPDYWRLAPSADNVGVLVWLVRRGILTEEELERRGKAWTGSLLDPASAEGLGTDVQVTTQVDVALAALAQLRQRPSFEVLMAQGWVTEGECVNALLNATGDQDFPSPGLALAWMMVNRFVSAERETQIFAEGATATPERAALLAEARQSLDNARRHLATSGKKSTGVGGRLLLSVGMLVVSLIGLVNSLHHLWGSSEPAAGTDAAIKDGLPTCDYPDVKLGIRRKLAGVDQADHAYERYLRGANQPADDMIRNIIDPAVKLDSVVEVGTSKNPSLRGCRATLVIDDADLRIPFGYVISADKDKPDTPSWTSVDPEIVQARFGKLTPEGGFLQNADPIGREELGRAVRAGFATLRQDRDSNTPMRAPDGKMSTVGELVALKVNDIEPLAPCTEAANGKGYRCRLLIAYNDPVSMSVEPHRVDGEFSFTRANAGAPWSVSPTFPREFDEALAASQQAATQQAATQQAASTP